MREIEKVREREREREREKESYHAFAIIFGNFLDSSKRQRRWRRKPRARPKRVGGFFCVHPPAHVTEKIEREGGLKLQEARKG